MQKIEKINYFDLIEVNKKINNPFSREIFISTIKNNTVKDTQSFIGMTPS